MKRKRLVLFDIDGTLITTGGAGTRSMNLAFEDVCGIKSAFEGISMAGKTDIQIIKEGLLKFGLQPENGTLEKLQDMYIHFLRREIDNPMRGLKPGIRESLELFREMGCPLGLLTGNLQKGAEIKLGAFGIYDYFIDGAFGSDDEDRDRLLPVAIEKFSKRGFAFKLRECIVVGDTPRDVQCAKVHGAFCIAVATGPYSREDLLGTEADIVVDSLHETGRYLHAVNGESETEDPR